MHFPVGMLRFIEHLIAVIVEHLEGKLKPLVQVYGVCLVHVISQVLESDDSWTRFENQFLS